MSTNQSTSRPFPNLLSLIVGIVLASVVLIVMYFLTPLNKSENTQGLITTQSESAPNNELRATFDTTNPMDKVQEVSRLSDILDIYQTSFDRSLAIYHVCSQASEQKLVSFFEDALELTLDESHKFWGKQFVGVVLHRLVSLNTEKAQSLFAELDLETQRDSAYLLTNEWSKLDLEGASQFVESLPTETIDEDQTSFMLPIIRAGTVWNMGMQNAKSNAAMGIIDSHRMLSEQELIALGETLSVSEYVDGIFLQVQLLEDARNPKAAWQEISADPEQLTSDNYGRLTNIIEAWVKQSGITVMNNVLETVPGDDIKMTLLDSALRVFVKTDPEQAFEYAIENSPSMFGYSSALYTVVHEWSRKDPYAALERVGSLESGMQRYQLLDSVFRNMARDDLQGFIEEIHRFPDNIRDSARGQAIESLMDNDDRDTAMAIFAELESSEVKSRTAMTIVKDWTDSDPKAAFNWVMNEPATEPVRSMLGPMVLRIMAHSNPDEAFAIAQNQPLESDDAVGLEAAVVSSIAMDDVDAALKLLPKVRDGKTKNQAYFGIGGSLARSGRISEAINLGNDLPADQLDSYYTAVGTNAVSMGGMLNGSDSDSSIFETIDLLPSENARSKTALSTILMDSFANNYSDEEIETLKEYLTEEDLKSLEEGEDQLDSFPMPFIGF